MTDYHGPFVANDKEARGLMSLVTGADVPAEPAGEGKTMGPGGAGRAPDHAARAAAFARRHPHVTIAATATGWTASWVEACAGPGDGEVHREPREHLGWLMDYLEARFDRAAHRAVPRPDSAYTMEGPRTGHLLDLRYGNCWPAEGTCAGCGMVLRREAVTEPWVHAGRKPGEAG